MDGGGTAEPGGARRRRVAAVAMAVAVGLAGVAAVASIGGALRSQAEDRREVVEPVPTGVVAANSTIGLIVLPGQNVVCDDVEVSHTRVGEYAIAARRGDVWARVTVGDDVGLVPDAAPDGSAAGLATRHEPELLLVVAEVSGPSVDAEALARTVLAGAQLSRAGTASSLHVDWPDGFRSVAAGVPVRVSAEWSLWRTESRAALHMADDTEPLAPEASDIPATEPSDSSLIEFPEPSDSVTAVWSPTDPLTVPMGPWGSVGGVVLIGTPESQPYRAADGTVAGHRVALLLSRPGATDSDAERMLADSTFAGTCPVPAAPAPDSLRAATGNVVVHASLGPDGCPTAISAVAAGSWVTTTDPDGCQAPFLAAATVRPLGATTELQPDPTGLLVGPDAASVSISAADGSTIASGLQPARSAVDGRVGLVTLPQLGHELVVLEATGADGAVVGRATLRVSCDLWDTCSSLHPLLASRPVMDEKVDGFRYAVHLGQVMRPLPDGEPYSGNVSLGPSKDVSAQMMWCAVLDGTGGPEIPGGDLAQESLDVCIPAASMAGNSMEVDINTLDRLDLAVRGLALAGDRIDAIRVTESGRTALVPVHRHRPGPGVALWTPDGYDGGVHLEGLDAGGQVIATLDM